MVAASRYIATFSVMTVHFNNFSSFNFNLILWVYFMMRQDHLWAIQRQEVDTLLEETIHLRFKKADAIRVNASVNTQFNIPWLFWDGLVIREYQFGEFVLHNYGWWYSYQFPWQQFSMISEEPPSIGNWWCMLGNVCNLRVFSDRKPKVESIKWEHHCSWCM